MYFLLYDFTMWYKLIVQPEMFNTEKYVIYKRVSGGHNQKSGLGLDAQSDEINAYLHARNN